jgi:hypothetical protein
MGDEFIPDYSKYNTNELIDVYNRIDKVNNPKRTKAIEEELRKKLNIDPILNFNDETVKQKLKNVLLTDNFEKIEKPKYEKKIRRGWISGIVVGCITILAIIISLNSPENSTIRENFNEWNFIDVVIVFVLSFGIYKKNKTAAILLLVYFLLPKVIDFIETGDAKVLTGGSIFVYFFVEAIRGISEYQKIKKENISETVTA